MAQFANIRIELDKLTRLADYKNLKSELNRLTQELKKKGEIEVAHVEKTVKHVRTRVLKLRSQVERELTKLRGLVKKAGKKKTAKRGTKATTRKTAARSKRKASPRSSVKKG